MITLFDNITATMIGGAVLLMIAAMHQQAQSLAVERAVTYVAKRNSIEFGQWLQEDLANIGSGMSIGSEVMEDMDKYDGITQSFLFRRKLTPDAVAPVWIEYRAVAMDTAIVGVGDFAKEAVLYQIGRYVDGSDTPIGGSMSTITDFDVDMLDGTGTITNDRARARELRISFSSAFSFSKNQKYLRENHWSTTVPLRSMN